MMDSSISVVYVVVIFICIENVYGICTPCQNNECHNAGTCIINETDCSRTCVCPSYFTGEFCEEGINDLTTPIPLKTTLRPISDRVCFFGMLTCEHGFCLNKMKCVCDEHWTGAKCEKVDCPLACLETCQLQNDIPECVDNSIDHDVVSTTTRHHTKDNSVITPAFLKQQTTTTPTLQTSNLRDIQERTCLPGYVCIHGYCKLRTLHCECDKNWKGSLCSDLDCPTQCINNCELINNVLTCIQDDDEIVSPTPDSETSLSAFNKEQTTEAVADDTSWSLEERTCMANFFVCVHGYCERKSTRFWCECDNNWTGTFCEKLNCPKCDHGCELQDGTLQCNALTLPQVSDKNLTSTISQNIVSSTTTATTTTELIINGTFPDGHVCSANYTQSTDMCMIPCMYGTCKQYINDQNVQIIKCVCDPGADGDLCNKKCCKLCGNHGRCQIDNNGTEYCNCEYDHKGEFCQTEIIPIEYEEETWYWIVVGVCVGLIVLLVLALVVLPYWMWRNRVILIMKIVHYFQRYEDNDEREWDAFVSYKCDDRDESFVLRQIYSKLEVEMGFKLCLHFRDFIPGDTISNNIIRAVQGSRRTILLLTPRYVQSEFTKFEYQMAQTEMLKRRHRIIPIVLDDISPVKEELDPNLEQIIHSVTYLEWPGDDESLKIQKFWKKLVLSMPKKKDVEERRKAMSNSSSNSPSSYNFSSQTSEIPLVTHSISSDSSHSNRVSLASNESNGHVPSKPIQNNDIILKITEDTLDSNSNREKSSNINSNLNNYLELIDPNSMNC